MNCKILATGAITPSDLRLKHNREKEGDRNAFFGFGSGEKPPTESGNTLLGPYTDISGAHHAALCRRIQTHGLMRFSNRVQSPLYTSNLETPARSVIKNATASGVAGRGRCSRTSLSPSRSSFSSASKLSTL